VAAIIVTNPGEWQTMMWGEGTPFVWLSCSLLLAAGIMALMAGIVTGCQAGPQRAGLMTRLAWFACGGGMLFADLDERFRIHERVTEAIGFTSGASILNHLHPVLVLYGVAGCLFAVVVFRRYSASWGVKGLLVAGVACYGVSVGAEVLANVTGLFILEEASEFTAAAAFTASFYVALLHEIAAIGPQEAPS